MASNSLTNRRLTARKPPVCHSGPAVGSILLPEDAAQPGILTALEKKAPGETPAFVPRTGRCPPPPPPPTSRVCELDPAVLEIGADQTEDINPFACAEALPEGENVDVDYVVTGGTYEGPTPIGNCSDPTQVEYTADVPPGSYSITATFTWSDAGQCVAVCAITVTGEEEEE